MKYESRRKYFTNIVIWSASIIRDETKKRLTREKKAKNPVDRPQVPQNCVGSDCEFTSRVGINDRTKRNRIKEYAFCNCKLDFDLICCQKI